jgi:hypothetical protein
LQQALTPEQQDAASWQHPACTAQHPSPPPQQEAQSLPQQEAQSPPQHSPHDEQHPAPHEQSVQAHESPQQHAAALECESDAAPAANPAPISMTSAEPTTANRFISGSFKDVRVVQIGPHRHTPAQPARNEGAAAR